MSDLLYQQTQEKVFSCLNKAAQFYGAAFPVSAVTFDLKGRSAGQVRFPLNNQLFSKNLPLIRFNADLLKQNTEQFLHEVVPHECAHVIVYHRFAQKFSLKRHRPKPHGIEWQTVMREVFNLEPRVTHDFVLQTSKSRLFHYQCSCEQKIHQVSLIRHNKMLKGSARYLCRACGSPLININNEL